MTSKTGFRYIEGNPLIETRPSRVFRKPKHRHAFAIFQETICDGVVPTWRDENGFPIIYASEREAQIEIAEMLIEQLRQFVFGEREFDDALTTGDFILPVEVWPDGTIQTEKGLRFGQLEQ